MRPTAITRILAPAALMAALGLPSTGAAQYRLPTITSVTSADSLYQAAVTMAQTRHRWREAARLHRRSAALRLPEDSMGFRSFREAAELSFAGNDLRSARSDMIQAASQALARGDVERAAHAYADAAWLANEQRRPADVWKLGRQAEILAGSPLLSAKQRAGILDRFIRPQPEVAQN